MYNAKSYTSEELKKLRATHIEILEVIEQICNRHNLEYVAIGGTALGAVRHDGYIPWDDDMDIAFMRPDYEKFIEYAIEELDDRFFLQNYKTEESCISYFSKIKRNGTVFLQESDIGLNTHNGIFVDIFPLDYVTESARVEKKYKRNLAVLYQLYIAKGTSNTMGETKSFSGKCKHMIRKILHMLVKPISKDRLYKKLDSEIQRFNSTESILVMESPVYAVNGISIPKKYYFPTQKHMFEGRLLNIPGNYHQYLQQRYGNDYMVLPPPERRVNHRPIELSFKEEHYE